MVDVSRNAVLKVEAVKRHIDQLAALGMNLLMLYTEDTFTVPEYAAFGYLRGAYTMVEMREIDRYAASLGVEVVPCIQAQARIPCRLVHHPLRRFHVPSFHSCLIVGVSRCNVVASGQFFLICGIVIS